MNLPFFCADFFLPDFILSLLELPKIDIYGNLGGLLLEKLLLE